MKKRLTITVLAGLLAATAAFAVFNEKNLSQTLSVLRSELGAQNSKMEARRQNVHSRSEAQHERMVEMIQKSNELALILYSQNQDFTFDVTYALKEATREYEEFNRRQMPYTDIITRLDLEIDRYERLIEALRRIPPVMKELEEVPDSISISTDSLRMHSGEMRRRFNGPAIGPGGTVLPQIHHDGPGRPAPFLLDSLAQIDRDSCLMYSRNLLRMYKTSKMRITIDSTHYAETNARLKETYDYAQSRYDKLQKKIFTEPQDNYFKVLRNLGKYASTALAEAGEKYSSDFGGYSSSVKSEWRGPVVTGFIIYVLLYLIFASLVSGLVIGLLGKFVKSLDTPEFKQRRLAYALLLGATLFTLTVMAANQFTTQGFFIAASRHLLVYAWLLMAILVSLLIHNDAADVRKGILLYLPVLLLGLVVITFRIVFIPNRLVNLILTPVLLLFFIWQAGMYKSLRKDTRSTDRVYSVISLLIIGTSLIMAALGYTMMSIQLLVWWLFQLTAIHTFTAIRDLMARYEEKYIVRKLRKEGRHFTKDDLKKGEFIRDTWLFDFVKITLVPALSVLSIPFCIYFASEMFDLTSIFVGLLKEPFFNITDTAGNVILHLSLIKIFLTVALYFVYKYLNYVLKATYKTFKLAKLRKESGADYIHANQLNLTLADNVVAILVWGTYIVMIILLFKIPMGALSLVAAGLATGLGLAMKDILNNFIYGLQLMSGRVRVGDMIECDGIRGRVERITYQSTQIVALDESLISFTNTALFNKNFKNLTRNSPYEFVKIIVGVGYGTDIEHVRQVILQAVGGNNAKDKYGRPIVEPKHGVTVVFDEFGESSVNIAVKQLVIVEKRVQYVAETQEKIYDALKEAGIEIPFPQRDVHIVK